MTTSNQDIARTILNQLGGGRFLAMTGSKNLVAGDSSLTMTLTRNKLRANRLKITLNAMDLYDIEYMRVTNPTKRNGFTGKCETLKTFDGYYNDMLVENFETETGLYTHL